MTDDDYQSTQRTPAATAPDTDTDSPVTGAIPRVERQQSHYEFLWAVRPPAAMTNLVHARRMLMHDQTASDWFPPETDVIVTSTIPDDDLREFTFEDELRLVREFDPDYYLPFDFPVYGDMAAEARIDHVRQVAAGTIDMNHILSRLSAIEVTELSRKMNLPRDLVVGEAETTVIPLIKGTTRDERGLMESVGAGIDAPFMAKYATQYMTVGGHFPALRDDLEAIEEEIAGYPMMVIGFLAPSGRHSLENLPENVVAAAGGRQWRQRVQPRSASPEEMRAGFQDLAVDVAEALDVPLAYDREQAAATSDTPPGVLETSPGKAATLGDGPTVAGCAGDKAYGLGGRKRPDDALGPVAARARRGNSSTDEMEAATDGGAEQATCSECSESTETEPEATEGGF